MAVEGVTSAQGGGFVEGAQPAPAKVLELAMSPAGFGQQPIAGAGKRLLSISRP